MTKAEYLKKLKKYLKPLPSSDYEEAMEYFQEYFEEMSEEEAQKAMQELGTPKEAASEILNQLLDAQMAGKEDVPKPSAAGKKILLAVLVLCAAPVGLPLMITALALVLAGILMAAVMLVCGLILCFAGWLIALKLFIRGLCAVTVSVPGALVLSGAGILGLGLGILAATLIVHICIRMVRRIALLAQNVSKKGGHKS